MNAPGQGRKPKPTYLKLLAGDKNLSRHVTNEPMPVGDLINPPSNLNDEERVIWIYAIEHAPLGLIKLLDWKLFLSWVLAAAEFDLAEKMLRENGREVKKGGDQRITIAPDGSKTTTVRSVSMVPSNWIKIRNVAFQRMMKAASELGFSPSSRTRISLGGAKKENKFANNKARA